MIREVCSCGAEFETDDREAIMLVKTWRKTHKHSERPSEAHQRDAVVLSNTDIALGFQSVYEPMEDE